jgi:hypothetical protein
MYKRQFIAPSKKNPILPLLLLLLLAYYWGKEFSYEKFLEYTYKLKVPHSR